MILDEPDRALDQALKCVVIGKSKQQASNDGQPHYILIISMAVARDHVRVWERVGVAVVERRDIAFDGSGTKVFIQ